MAPYFSALANLELVYLAAMLCLCWYWLGPRRLLGGLHALVLLFLAGRSLLRRCDRALLLASAWETIAFIVACGLVAGLLLGVKAPARFPSLSGSRLNLCLGASAVLAWTASGPWQRTLPPAFAWLLAGVWLWLIRGNTPRSGEWDEVAPDAQPLATAPAPLFSERQPSS